ncbi:Ig protein, partial [Pseudomonas caricapapayae]
MTPRLPNRRYHQALALEPRILLDAAAAANAEKVVAATDTQAGMAATGVEATVTIKDTDGQQSVGLFSGTRVNTDGSGQALTTLTVTVNSSGANQALVIDGSTIALESTGYLETATNGYTYSVTVSGEITTITLSLNSSDNSPSAVARLVDGIRYSTLDNSVTSRSLTVNLATLSDTDADTTLDIGSHITVTSDINVAPSLSTDGALTAAESYSLSDLGGVHGVSYDSSGSHAYVAGDNGISVYNVDSGGRLTLLQTFVGNSSVGSVSHMVLSSDGTSLYTVSGSESDSSIYQLNVASNGTLSYAAAYDTGHGAITGNLAMSTDGKFLYAGSQWSSLLVFSRDAATGALAFASTPAADSDSNGVISVAGNYVYVLYTSGDHALNVFVQNSDGSLSDYASVLTGNWGFSAVDYAMVVSSNNEFVFVGDPDTGTLQVYHLNGGSLSLLSSDSANGIESLALNSSGNQLYVAQADGTVSLYNVSAGGALALASSRNGGSSVASLALSADGRNLLVAGTELGRYSGVQDLTFGQALAFATGVAVRDSNNDALANGTGDYQGSSLSVTASVAGGTFGFIDGDGLTYANGVVSYNGRAIATLTSTDTALALTFTAATSTSEANQVVHRLSYTLASGVANPGSQVSLSLNSSDGRLSSNSVTLVLRSHSTPELNHAAATGYTLATATSETAYSFTLLNDLFSDADGDILQWSASGLPDGIVFDTSTRTLSGSTTQTGDFNITISVADAAGGSASTVLALHVEQIANRAPEPSTGAPERLPSATESQAYSLVLNNSLFQDADSVYGDTLSYSIRGLPIGLNFDASTLTISGVASTLGSYRVTVTATDAAGSSSENTFTLRVITAAEADNRPPQVVAEASSISYSSDGVLSGYSYYVNSMKLSADGTLLIIAGSTMSNGGGTSYLSVYGRNANTGALTLDQTFVQGTADDGNASNGIEADGLNRVSSISYSADGTYLTVAGYSASGGTAAYSLTLFSIDNGSLARVGSLANISEQVVEIAHSQDGSTLYALSATSLYAYHVASDGSLNLLGAYSDNYATAVALQVAEDGNLYVLSSNRLTVFASNSAGGLEFAGQLVRSGSVLTYTDREGASTVAANLDNNNAFSGANALVVGKNGYLYTVTTNGFLTTLQYDTSGNSISLIDAQDAYIPLSQYPSGLAISADGTALYVVGGASSTLALYSIGTDGVPLLAQRISIDGGATVLAISADGASIYAGVDLYYAPGLRVLSSDGAYQSYSEGSTQTVTARLALSDHEYDNLAGGSGNYNGATITLVRAGGADASDSFNLAQTGGITLGAGVVYLNGESIATLTTDQGQLNLRFTADVSTATANLVLKQIAYTNASQTPGDTISLSLSVADQYAATPVPIHLAVLSRNEAPTLIAQPGDVTYSAGGQPIKVFNDAQASTVESDQLITGLTVTVAGLADGENESLSIAGEGVALTDGNSAFISVEDGEGTSYYVSVNVVVSSGVATLTISADGLPASVAGTLVDSLGYANNAVEASTGTRTITLVAISDNGGTDNGGSDTSSLDLSTNISVSPVNQAPTLSPSGLNTTFTENGNARGLFSDVQLSAGERGQAISSLVLTVGGLTDGSMEVLVIDGTDVALVTGSGTTTHGYNYSVATRDGQATVILSSPNSITTSSTEALISGLAYSHSGDDPSPGVRSITLSAVQDDGGAQNGGADTATLAITARVTVGTANDAPVLQGRAQSASYGSAGSSAKLFSDVSISTVETTQSIASISFTVTGLANGANETITVDGTRIALSAGTGSTAHYSWRVSVGGSTATLILTSTRGVSSSDAANVINQATYANLSNTQSAGTRSISVSVQDNGGTADGGSDTGSLASSAEVKVVNNHTPVLIASAEDSSLSLADSPNHVDSVTSSALSSDGSTLYTVDANGYLTVLSRNTGNGSLLAVQTLATGLASPTAVSTSADGSHVYVLGNNGNAIAVLVSESGGSLTQVQTLGVEHVVGLAVGGDGSALYVIDGTYSGLKAYSLQSDGSYSLSQSLAASTNSEPYLFNPVALQAVGDYLYVVTDPASSSVAKTLIVYQRNSDGSLGTAAYLRDGTGNVMLGDAVSLSVSNDGSSVAVASGTSVALVSFDSRSQTLAWAANLDGLNNVTSAALSSDASLLYVAGGAGTLARYSVEGGSFSLQQTLTGLPAGQVLSASAGSVVVSGGNAGAVSLVDAIDSELQVAYTERASVLLASGVSLHDADYDALNGGLGDYTGATLSVSREGGASNEDTFGFTAGNGLSLSAGVLYLNGTAIATFNSDNGSLLVTFTASTSTATANAVLSQLSYRLASSDPASSVRLSLSVADSYGSSATTSLVMNVTAVNTSPTLQAKANSATWYEGNSATVLFDSAQVSTIEAGQAISSLTLSISGLADGSAEILSVDGTLVSLVAGSGTTQHGYAYSVHIDGAMATLVVSSSEGISGASTAALVDGLAYANTSQDPTAGSRSINLVSMQDTGGVNHGGNDTTALALKAEVTVVALNDAPTLASSGRSQTLAAGHTSGVLFEGTAVSTVETAQRIIGLSLQVDGVPAAGDALFIDGVQVLLQDGFSATGNSGAAIHVSFSGGTARIDVSGGALLSSQVQALVDGIQYAAGENASGVRTITLRAAQDSGGSAEGGYDRSVLAVTAELTVTRPAQDVSQVQVAPIVPLNRGPANPFATAPTGAFALPSLTGPTFVVQPGYSAPPLVLGDDWERGSLATGSVSVAAQLSQASELLGGPPEPRAREGNLSVRSGSLSGALASDSSLTLPHQLPDGSQPVGARLASGLPLPNWLRFDPRRGRLQAERTSLARLGSVRLALIGRDADGRETRTELELHANPEP